MDVIHALVVDDELPARLRIQELLEKQISATVVGTARDGAEAVRMIRIHNPELVFLDVQMPLLDGFGVVREIGPHAMPVTIFVTAFDSFAMRAFEANALDYLLKPFSDERFEAAFLRARTFIANRKVGELGQQLVTLLTAETPSQAAARHLDRIVLRTAGRVHLLETRFIDWIEGAGVYVVLHVGSKTHEYRSTVGQLEQRLDPQQFIRVHRSTIVNTERIKELQARTHGDFTILLRTGTELTLSRAYRSHLEAWLKHSL
jgi:two-component system LytT family response regulator